MWCIVCVLLCKSVNCCKHSYSLTELWTVGVMCNMEITRAFQWSQNIPEDISRSPWLVFGPGKWHCQLPFANVQNGPGSHSPPILLTRLIVHKTDDSRKRTETATLRDCSSIIITESLLHPLIPDATVQLTGRSLQCFITAKEENFASINIMAGALTELTISTAVFT
ncbi:hypothetical protein ILYODFUR_011894 [Ilyodon furcidens]|uniref:Secreted protein n=1 Tax=Ilyodon furcidens TaxID=33524 RepID=A0ABV0T788_9TELE